MITVKASSTPSRAVATDNRQTFNANYTVGVWDTAGDEDITIEATGDTIQEVTNRQAVTNYLAYIAGGGTDPFYIWFLTYIP